MNADGASRCNLCGHDAHSWLTRKNGFDVIRCRRCGLIFVANQPTDEDRRRQYSFGHGYHQELAENAQTIESYTREAERNLAILSRHGARGRLLDIGCSTGLFLDLAVRAGWEGRGLEYSADSSRTAREQHGLQVVTGELDNDTFPAGAFDAVTLWDVIEHVPDPRSLVRRIGRLLAADGMVFIKTPNADGLYPRAALAVAKPLRFWGHPTPPGHLYQFTVKTLTRLLHDAGFDVVRVYHRRIPISYSFGTPREWFRSVKWAVYCAAFVPLAWIGSILGAGDDQIVVARKRPTTSPTGAQ